MAKVENTDRILMIVESPNKVKTLKQFLPSNYVVCASVGHITKIADDEKTRWNTGIETKGEFKAHYVISEDKRDVVAKLRDQVKMADKVILATDPDREGEAISWHLKTQLHIPENKYERVTYHEITKQAVEKALANPRKIDMNLVLAALRRQQLDKFFGYGLSNNVRKNVKVNGISAKSAGRCQSPGLLLIVNREEEIINFKPQKYYDLYLHFTKNGSEFKAKYVGTDKKEVKQLPNLDACEDVGEACYGKPYTVTDIQTKEVNDYPKPPFCTSTFQQEVSKQLGISIKSAMDYAQELFEGVDVAGKHVALITYIRTDDMEFAPEFLPVLERFVKDTYGKKYYAPVRKVKKNENAQEGHEAIRVIDLEMTTDKLKKYITDNQLLKVYDIIYKRTVAASMAPAVISNTQYVIKNGDNKFVMNSNELRFDGYKKVYSYNDSDDKDEIIKETFNISETLGNTRLKSIEKETTPPKRYTEASFIKELDKQGIGRPSTYASIVGTLLSSSRNYCNLDGKGKEKFINPSELGMKLSHYLTDSFPDLINISYTRELEKDLDLIANGKLDDIEFIKAFYEQLEASIKKVDPVSAIKVDKVCPDCGKPLVVRKGKYGEFLGCSGYPKCKHMEKIQK